MRKIILDLAVSLDGFIEGPNGEIDWLEGDANTDFAEILNDILVGIDAIFYGRISYEMWGNYQPSEDSPPKLIEAYKQLHQRKKYVFSNSGNQFEGAEVISGDIHSKVLDLKDHQGGNIWLYGGGSLTTTFVNLDLIDVYRLAVHPVILGSGKPLFQNIQTRIDLKLTQTTPAHSGVILLKYEK